MASIPLGSRAAIANDDRWGLGYCPPPYPPACVAHIDGTLESSVKCGKETEAYIASVFRYRECVANETERAVREANHVLDVLKCGRSATGCQTGNDRPAP